MTKEAIIFAVIMGIAIVAMFVVAFVERRHDGDAIREAFDMGYELGYEEAATRAYTFTKAFNIYQDWESFREDLDTD